MFLLLLPFIYLFLYPFLSHELVFIIGCIYVVKLCGKVSQSSCSRLTLVCYIFHLLNSSCFFALHSQITLRWNCVLCAQRSVVFMGSFWPLLPSSNAWKAFWILLVCPFFYLLFLSVFKDTQRFGAMNTRQIRAHALNSIHNLNHVRFDIQLHCFHTYIETWKWCELFRFTINKRAVNRNVLTRISCDDDDDDDNGKFWLFLNSFAFFSRSYHSILKKQTKRQKSWVNDAEGMCSLLYPLFTYPQKKAQVFQAKENKLNICVCLSMHHKDKSGDDNTFWAFCYANEGPQKYRQKHIK